MSVSCVVIYEFRVIEWVYFVGVHWLNVSAESRFSQGHNDKVKVINIDKNKNIRSIDCIHSDCITTWLEMRKLQGLIWRKKTI